MSTVPFDYNKNVYGGTEYMASNVAKRILPDMPKAHNYLSLCVPGPTPDIPGLINWNGEIIMWMHNTPEQFGADGVFTLRHPEFQKRLKYIITPSEEAKRFTIETTGISADKIYVIHNAIEPLVYNKDKFNNTDQVRIINTSSPDRGLDILMESLEYIEEDFRLEIYNTFNPDLVEPREYDPRVRFFARTPRATVLEAFSNAHIHAYPSTYFETFCLSQVEAMSAGCLCVYPNIGALKEVSGGYGKAFDLPPTREEFIRLFADNLSQAIRDVKANLVDTSEQVQYINSKFSWDAIRTDWLKFHELI
jgi:glycosyltransferase involved in cell wall biosynthesis